MEVVVSNEVARGFVTRNQEAKINNEDGDFDNKQEDGSKDNEIELCSSNFRFFARKKANERRRTNWEQDFPFPAEAYNDIRATTDEAAQADELHKTK